MPTNEAEKKPTSVVTARGSQYTYLEDGRTQRWKAATDEKYEPQDILVFIPPWEQIAEKAKELYPEIFKEIETQAQFEYILLVYIHSKESAVRPIDTHERTVHSLSDIPTEEPVF